MVAGNLTRAEQAAADIRRAIATGEYVSGERVVEIALARRLNVSQITVREALWLLEQEGWVVKRARRGVFVREFDAQAAAELFLLLETLMRMVLERLAAMNGRRAALREAHGCVEAARRHAQSDERSRAIDRLFEGHAALAAQAGLPLTDHMLISLINQTRLLETIRQARVPGSAAEILRFVEQHERLLERLESGDAAGAAAQLHGILQQYQANVAAALRLA